jgi:hypothetical protein
VEDKAGGLFPTGGGCELCGLFLDDEGKETLV